MARPRSSTRAWVEQLESWSARHLWKWETYLIRELSRQCAEGKPLVFCRITLDIRGHSVSVQVTADRPHFKGVRLWFWCPRCRRRILKVYQWPGQSILGCRHCFRLVYGQQMRKGRGIVYAMERFWNGVYDSNPWRFLRECDDWRRRRNRRLKASRHALAPAVPKEHRSTNQQVLNRNHELPILLSSPSTRLLSSAVLHI